MPVDATRLVTGLHALGSGTMAAAAPLTARYAAQDSRVPRGQTGELANSIRAEGGVRTSGTVSRGQLVADVLQAATTELGARPHVIVPRRARVLRFPSGGRMVYARRVNHPGNAPAPWWRDVVTDAFRKALPEAARQAGAR